MVWKYLVAAFGTILALLGALWFLQGSGIIQLRPTLCVAECEPLVGRSLQWQYTGAITFVLGALILGLSLRRISRRKRS